MDNAAMQQAGASLRNDCVINNSIKNKMLPADDKYCKVLSQGEHIPGRVVIAEGAVRVAVEPKANCSTCSGSGRMTMLIRGFRVVTECPCVTRRYKKWKEGVGSTESAESVESVGSTEGIESIESTENITESIKHYGHPLLDHDILQQIDKLEAKLSALQVEKDAADAKVSAEVAEVTASITCCSTEIDHINTQLCTCVISRESIIEEFKSAVLQAHAKIEEITRLSQENIVRLERKIRILEAQSKAAIESINAEMEAKQDEMAISEANIDTQERTLQVEHEALTLKRNILKAEADSKKSIVYKEYPVPIAQIRRTVKRINDLKKRLEKRQAQRALRQQRH